MSAINYSKINWTDYPSTTTPINAANLGKMDTAIYDLDQQLGDKVTYNNAVKNLALSLSGTTLTITTSDPTS